MPKNSLLELNELNFETVVAGAAPRLLLDFTATWCPPCHRLLPILEGLAEELPPDSIARIDADENPNLAARYGVRAMPTLILLERGEEVRRRVGFSTPLEVRKFLEGTA